MKLRKKLFVAITTLCLMLGALNSNAFASESGIIDLRETWLNYDKAVKIDKLLDQKEVDLEKYVLEKKRKIADGKTPLERKNLEDRYAKEFKTKLNAIQSWYKAEQKKLDANMIETIKKVAASKKLSTVLRKKAVVYGGIDITQDVIKALNKK